MLNAASWLHWKDRANEFRHATTFQSHASFHPRSNKRKEQREISFLLWSLATWFTVALNAPTARIEEPKNRRSEAWGVRPPPRAARVRLAACTPAAGRWRRTPVSPVRLAHRRQPAPFRLPSILRIFGSSTEPSVRAARQRLSSWRANQHAHAASIGSNPGSGLRTFLTGPTGTSLVRTRSASASMNNGCEFSAGGR
jgi:hypothetical protein